MTPRRQRSLKETSGIKNKIKREQVRLKEKKAKALEKREARFKRKKEEEKNPRLREERLATNKPVTVDLKRVWDEYASDDGDDNLLGKSIDLSQWRTRRKLDTPQPAEDDEEASEDEGSSADDEQAGEEQSEEREEREVEAADQRGEVHQAQSMERAQGAEEEDDDADSMLEFSDSEGDDNPADNKASIKSKKPPPRSASPAVSSTTSRLDITPQALALRFPKLFATPAPDPKILITTCLNSTLHHEGQLLTDLFPNSIYIPRQKHHHSHKFSVREISRFAANRNYTAVIILNEIQKRPSGLDIVTLPEGPMFHFSMTNWVEGKKLPGHGRSTGHIPELILNNFKTPLGILTAHLFRTLYPPKPQTVGRQVVTLHNQRDYIFLRRHRYIFRDKRATEKSVQGEDGRPMKGVEDIKAGLQELGPRFTLKLRRIDKGIQRASGQEWQWKTKTDRMKTKFQL